MAHGRRSAASPRSTPHRPGRDDCPIEIAGDRLVDCDARSWTFDGVPLDPAGPPLERIPVEVDSGSVVLDMTRRAED